MNKALKKFLIIIGVIIIFLIIMTSCSSFEEEDIDSSNQTTTVANTTTLLSTLPPEPSFIFDGLVCKKLFIEIYTSTPIWIEDGWYVTFNCYNKSPTFNVDFIFDLPVSSEIDIWETVRMEENKTFRLKIGDDINNPPQSIQLFISSFMTGFGDIETGIFFEEENYIIKYK